MSGTAGGGSRSERSGEAESSVSDGAPFRLDRRALVRAFSRAGASYEEAAGLQAHVAEELLERLRFFALQPRLVLDLGAGTGRDGPALRARFPNALVLAVDIAEGMLRAAASARRWRLPGRGRPQAARVCADAYALPLPDCSVDLAFSNLMLQWCDRPGQVFDELARVLRPGALLVFSTFGPATLSELRDAWSQADAQAHISRFPAMQELGDGLMHAGLSEPVMDVEQRRTFHRDAYALMRELKRLGATNAASLRARGLTGRARWGTMIGSYETLREPRGLPATYEVIYGSAFGAGRRGATHGVPELEGAEVRIPVDALRPQRGGS